MPEPDHKAYKGWRGTIAAMLQHHPEKFSKEACKKKVKGKLCPYAVATAQKEEGDKPHYKEQPHTQTGTPHKKEKYKSESFAAYVEARDNERKKKLTSEPYVKTPPYDVPYEKPTPYVKPPKDMP
jgi:hypothetical protein